MDNPFTESVLIKSKEFNSVIDAFEDLSYIDFIAESISKHPISYHNFFKFSNVLAKSKSKNLEPYQDSLEKIVSKDMITYQRSKISIDLDIRKLNILPLLKNGSTREQLFIQLSEHLYKQCPDLRVQHSILSGWNKISNDNKKISHLVQDILSPKQKLYQEEVMFSVIKLDSYPMALTYKTNNSTIETFLNNFLNHLQKQAPEFINHIVKTEDRRYVQIYLDTKIKADIFIDLLETSLNENENNQKLTFKPKSIAKNLDKIITKNNLEYVLPIKSEVYRASPKI
jgi:hypothetical protein